MRKGLGKQSHLEHTGSTGGREERILKQRDRKDLKEGSSGFAELSPGTKATDHLVPMSGSSTSFSVPSVSSCANFCRRELLWNFVPQQDCAKREPVNKELPAISKS